MEMTLEGLLTNQMPPCNKALSRPEMANRITKCFCFGTQLSVDHTLLFSTEVQLSEIYFNLLKCCSLSCFCLFFLLFKHFHLHLKRMPQWNIAQSALPTETTNSEVIFFVFVFCNCEWIMLLFALYLQDYSKQQLHSASPYCFDDK